MIASKPRQFYGLALVVATIRELDPTTRREVVESLREKMPLLARLADRCEFIFSDFRRLDDSSLFEAFNRFGEKDWAVAWKLTEDPLKERILSLLRPDRRKEFLDFAAAQPKMPRTQVLAVQFHLASKAADLVKSGKLRLLNPKTVQRAAMKRKKK